MTHEQPWIPVTERLPEHALQSVIVLQMFFEDDGTPRNIFRGDTTLPFMQEFAFAHCHQDFGEVRWSPSTGSVLRTGPNWRVVAWRPIPSTTEFCERYK